jgi:ferredoxin
MIVDVRVAVDPGKCMGHARCIAAVPDVFDEDEQGHSFVRDEDVPSELEAAVRLAQENCPEQAIETAG